MRNTTEGTPGLRQKRFADFAVPKVGHGSMAIDRHRGIIVVASAAIMLLGCKPAEKQYDLEAQSAKGIMRMLEDYHFEHPNVPVTNLSQLLRPDQAYPHSWHQRFERFGKHAGFTNSIFEKYVFFSRGITNPLFRGELVLMNAKPYPGPDGPERKVISMVGGRSYYQVLDETSVQRLFREVGLEEPKPVTMPRPPPTPLDERRVEPISEKISNLIIRTAMSMGFTGDQALIVRLVVLGLPFVLLPLFIFGLWRRSASKK